MAMSRILMTMSGFILASLGFNAAAEEKIPLDQVPSVVMKAVKDKFPEGKIEEVTKEVEKGRTIFEVEVDAKGGEYTLSLKEDGTIVEIEKVIAEKDLPADVTTSLKAEFPGAKLKELEEVTKGNKVTYEVQVVEKGKKAIEVVLDAHGKILEKKAAEEDQDEKKD